MKKNDWILLSTVLLLAALFLLFQHTRSSRATSALVYQGGELVKTISLSTVEQPFDFLLEGEGYTAQIEVERGRIRYRIADCPDQVCVHSGWLSRPGEVATCLPARSYIVIQGNAPEVDGRTGRMSVR